jgi:Xaa-Pro aminopeptidase
MDHASRRQRLATRLPEVDAEAFLITRLPNVRYLAGFTGSNGQLLLTTDDAVFLTDGRYVEQSRREVPDLRRGAYSGDIVPAIGKAISDLGVSRVAFESAGVTYQTFTQLSALGIALVPTSEEVERLRRIKDAEERGALAAAQAIADQAFDLLIGKLVEGVTERQVAIDLEVSMRALGAEGISFDTIVAFGENSAEPHHHPTDRPLGHGDLVKVDFGSVVGGYHSDMTRTVAFGTPPAQLREVYEVVRRAQQAGVEAVGVGVPCADVDRATRDLIREAGYAEEYRHPVGHGVGLEIHEQPWLRQGSNDVLPEGTVVTVEPGVYLDGQGGVRIEDMVEVTVDGGRVLPRTSKELMVL